MMDPNEPMGKSGIRNIFVEVFQVFWGFGMQPCSQLKPLLIFTINISQFKGPSPEALRLVQSQVQRVEQDDCHVAARLQYDLLEKLLGWRS